MTYDGISYYTRNEIHGMVETIFHDNVSRHSIMDLAKGVELRWGAGGLDCFMDRVRYKLKMRLQEKSPETDPNLPINRLLDHLPRLGGYKISHHDMGLVEKLVDRLVELGDEVDRQHWEDASMFCLRVYGHLAEQYFDHLAEGGPYILNPNDVERLTTLDTT